jgi:hypothetical protein
MIPPNIEHLDDVLDALAVSVAALQVDVDALTAEVEVVELHVHPWAQECYGGTAADDTTFVRLSPTPVTFISGNNAWGEEKQLTAGNLIGGGDSAKLFDMDTLKVSSVSAANKPVVLEIYKYDVGAAVTCTFVGAATDTVVKIGHGLVLHDRVVVDAPGNSTLLPSTVYYVIAGGLTADAFQVSTTQAGTKAEITTDAAAGSHYHKVSGYTLLTETMISAASTQSDSPDCAIRNHRVACNLRMSLRSKCANADITINAHFELHVYDAV